MKLPKAKYWYHATSIDRAESIVKDGFLRSAGDGIYFANTSRYASNFALLQGLKTWAVIQVPRQTIADQLELSHSHWFAIPKDCYFAVYRGTQVPVSNHMITLGEVE
jgi:hypothetical protein